MGPRASMLCVISYAQATRKCPVFSQSVVQPFSYLHNSCTMETRTHTHTHTQSSFHFAVETWCLVKIAWEISLAQNLILRETPLIASFNIRFQMAPP